MSEVVAQPVQVQAPPPLPVSEYVLTHKARFRHALATFLGSVIPMAIPLIFWLINVLIGNGDSDDSAFVEVGSAIVMFMIALLISCAHYSGLGRARLTLSWYGLRHHDGFTEQAYQWSEIEKVSVNLKDPDTVSYIQVRGRNMKGKRKKSTLMGLGDMNAVLRDINSRLLPDVPVTEIEPWSLNEPGSISRRFTGFLDENRHEIYRMAWLSVMMLCLMATAILAIMWLWKALGN